MSNYTDATPIATPDQFRKALLAVRDRHGISDNDLLTFKTQCSSVGCEMTSPQLASALGFKTYSAANLTYGKLARSIAEQLGFTPEKRPDGSTRWWRTIAYGDGELEEGENFKWIMRPELVEALKGMKWVT